MGNTAEVLALKVFKIVPYFKIKQIPIAEEI